jgi:N-acetylglutamate synthase/N-acetylornithine aminotransferase
MAKGVGMIEPAMATLLVVLTTDAPLGGPLARRLLTGAVRTTFNRISVDGDGSTSDTVALLASGPAHPRRTSRWWAGPCTRSVPTSPNRSSPTARAPAGSRP